jgi:hypothetical protein
MKQRNFVKTKEQLQNLFDRVGKMPIPETGWVIEIDQAKNNRTLAQNRLLWRRVYQPVAEQISESTGTLVTKDMIHKFFQDRFSPREIVKVMGQTICSPKSTTRYTKAEMSDYMEKCYAWGAEHGVWFDD